MKGLGRFDQALFLNLPHRTDRLQQIIETLEAAGFDSKRRTRLEATLIPFNGHLGCVLSHIDALDLAWQEGWPYALIFEDDFEWLVPPLEVDQLIELFFHHFQTEWDLLLLGTNIYEWEPTSHPQFGRVLRSVCAHGYAVSRHYIPTLRACFAAAAKKLEEQPHFRAGATEALDQAWQPLQQQGRWYTPALPISRQRASPSDIYHSFRDRIYTPPPLR